MRSYWEQKHFAKYCNIIVGVGVSGLFSAVNLKRKFPQERVLVVEKGWIGCGASTRNAGFACMGSITELDDDLQFSSESEIVSLFEKRYKGLEIMRKELGDHKIGYRNNGSYELLGNKEALENLAKWNKALHFIENCNAFSAMEINNFSFKGFNAAIKNELEGEIDTGKLIYSLLQKAKGMGVEFMQKTQVKSFEKTGVQFLITTDNNMELQCTRLILCTNAFTKKLVPAMDIKPGRGQVLVTKPINSLNFNGIYHFDRGYYYFREIDGRVLFGGGRQLDIAGEETNVLGENKIILEDLKAKLQENILPNIAFEVDYSWSGIMAFHKSKEPICKQVQEGLFVLAGFGGMGVALAPFMASELVSRIESI